MTNDAKLGLVLGVAIVLIIALVFFRQEALAARSTMDPGRSITAIQPIAPIGPMAPSHPASASSLPPGR